MTDQDILLRFANADQARPCVFKEKPVGRSQHVAKRRLGPQLACEAERSAGPPAVSGIAQMPFAGQQYQETVPGNQTTYAVLSLKVTYGHVQKIRTLMIVVIQCLDQ